MSGSWRGRVNLQIGLNAYQAARYAGTNHHCVNVLHKRKCKFMLSFRGVPWIFTRFISSFFCFLFWPRHVVCRIWVLWSTRGVSFIFSLFSSLSFVLLALHIHRKLLTFCPREQRVSVLCLSRILKASPHSAPRVEFTPFISPPTSSSPRCCPLPWVTKGWEVEWLRLGASQSWGCWRGRQQGWASTHLNGGQVAAGTSIFRKDRREPQWLVCSQNTWP